MTNQEAIENLKAVIKILEWEHPLDYAVAVEKGIEAIQKQIPFNTGNQFVGKCRCGRTVYPHMKHCSDCGQALDWSGEE